MIDIKIKYQASVFTPSIDAVPVNISQMMDLFADKGFIPTTYQELSTVIPTPQLRFSLNSPNNEWFVHFKTGRIDIEKKQTDVYGSNIGSIEQFCRDASDIFSKIINKYKQKANRLAISSNLILKEMSPQILDEIYLKLFNPTKKYLDNKPFEWDLRMASHVEKKINGNDELLSFIVGVNRAVGQMNFNQSIVPFDRIVINPDINTVHTNLNNRFGEDDIIDFYKNVHVWYEELLNDIFEKIK